MVQDLVVVSNREPYVHVQKNHKLSVKRSIGGVATALDALLQEVGGTWIAWGSGSGDRQTVDEKNHVMVPPSNPRYVLRRLFFEQTAVDGFYNGFSNQVLWPLAHQFLERIHLQNAHYISYRQVNEEFARAAIEECKETSTLFINDYQFLLVPGMVRHERPALAILFYWHIPWPSYNLWRLLPQRTALLKGILGASVIGFQTHKDQNHFLQAVEAELQIKADTKGNLTWQDRTIATRVLPVSIDTAEVSRISLQVGVQHRSKRFRLALRKRSQRLVLSVDRLDYSKGIPQRFEAIDLFLKRHPDFVGKVQFLMITPPSRTQIAEYKAYAEEVNELATKLNAKWRTARWRPVRLVAQSLTPKHLFALYRAADVAWVSSLQDGLNLVAKEYIVAQRPDENGVLVLSEGAGVSEELKEALLYSPIDPEGAADTLYHALTIPQKERDARFSALRQSVRNYTLQDWLNALLSEVPRDPKTTPSLDAQSN